MARLPSPDDLAGNRPNLLVGGGVAVPRPGGRTARVPDVRLPDVNIPDTRVSEAEGRALEATGNQLSKLGDSVFQILQKEREQQDTIRVEDAFNQLRAKQVDLTLGPESGFTRELGGNAVNKPIVEDWTKKFDSYVEELSGGLANPDQVTKFKARAAIARTQYQGDLFRHVATQTDHYAKDVLKGTFDTELRNIGIAPADESAAGLSFERVQAAVIAEGRRVGKPSDAIASDIARATDSLWNARLEAWRTTDPVGALRKFQDVSLSIGPDTRGRLAESLYRDAAPVLAANLNDAGGPPVTATQLVHSGIGVAGRDDPLRGELGVLKRPDGGVSTELSVTVTDPRINGGRATNIPLLVVGQKGVDALLKDAAPSAEQEEIAIRRAVERLKGGGRLPSYNSIEEATRAAESRPESDKTPYNRAQPAPPANAPRGIRNNNPGNIVNGPTRWEGQIEGADPRYASFATPEAGIRAMGKNLLAYGSRGLDTVAEIIARWAPATENNTVAYIDRVAKEIGVKPTDPLNLSDRKTLTALATAIIRHENGAQPYSAETINAGIDAALGGKSFAYEAKRTPAYSVASLATMTASDALAVQTGNPVIDRLPPDQKINVFHIARTQANQGVQQAREALRSRYSDTVAAFERGMDSPNPPSRTELIQAFGQFDGEKLAADMDLARQFGQDVRSVQNLSATQQAALLATRRPTPGAGFEVATKRHEMLTRAVEKVAQERSADSALAVLRNAPQVQAAYQNFTAAMTGGDPTKLSAAAQAYATATLAEQQRLEVSNPTILTKEMVESIAARFAAPPAAGENVANVMRGMVEQWGRYWPQIQRQLGNKVPPEASVIGLGVSPEMEALLAEASKLKPEQLKAGLDEPTIKDLRERVREALAPLQKTLAFQGGGTATYDNFLDSAEKAATMLLARGMKPGDAAAKAAEGLVGFKYEFDDTWRVPKSALGGGTSVSSIRFGADIARKDIGTDKPVVGEKQPLAVPAVPAGVRAEDAERQWRETVAANGFWVTTPGDGGLTLYVRSGLGAQPVLDAFGRPVTRTWSQLSSAGNSIRAAFPADMPRRKR